MDKLDLWNPPRPLQPREGFLQELESITARAMQRLTQMSHSQMTESQLEANAIAMQRLVTFNIELRSVKAKLQNGRIDKVQALKLMLAAFEQWRIEVERG